MRFLRIRHSHREYFARWVDEATARLWTAAPWAPDGKETDRLVPLRPGSILAPVTPSKIVCVGRNYRAHAKELGHEVPTEPLLFLKPPSALLAPEGNIELTPMSSRVEYEGEIAVVIGTQLRNGDERRAREAIFGVTCANDVTARDLQKKDVQFTRAKGFDTFCPVGPWIETEIDVANVQICTRVNGAERQRGAASEMVFPIASLISFISRVMTLEPGDLVLTGTPEGVGPLEPRDVVEVEIPEVGTLRNVVSLPVAPV